MSTPDFTDQNGIIWSFISLVKRRWIAGSALFVLVLATAIYVIWSAHPTYRADTKIRIGEPPPAAPVGSTGSTLFGFMRLGGDPFANDMELLGSRTVNEAVVRDASLTMRIDAPAGWHRDSLFSAVSTADSTTKARFEATWRSDGRIDVQQLTPRERAIGTFAPGAPVTLAGVTVAFKARKARGPEQIEISTVPFGEAVRRTSTAIKVARKRRDANVAEIRFVDSDPGVARAVVASVLAHFVAFRTQIARREGGQNVDSLRVVARQTQADLLAAENALEKHERSSGLVDPTSQNPAFVKRYDEVAAQLERVRAQLGELSAALGRADEAKSPAERWTKLVSFEPFLNNGMIGGLLGQLNTLEAKRAELAPRRTETNREYATVVDQINYIDKSLSSLARDVESGLRSQMERLEETKKQLDASFAALPANVIELGRRQRSTRVLSDVLMSTEQRLRQEELRQALSFSNIQVIDPPALRFKPVWPRKKIGLAIGILLAGMTALIGMAVMEQADRRVRHAGDVMRLTGAPVLGVALRQASALRFGAHELRALVQHASANGRGPLRVLFAPVGRTDVHDLAQVVRLALPAPVAAGTFVEVPEIQQASNITDFASASAAAGAAVPVTLVIEAEHTTRNELQRAAILVRQAGGTIGGTVVVCTGKRSAAEIWE